MKPCSLLLLALVGVALVPMLLAEGDFPPPPMPHPPKGFNLHCDVCYTMMKRIVPYCEREEQNMDFLPDFCTFNYNSVLRTECDFLVDVMEYAWCPNACTEVRRIKLFTGERICHHPLVNCTERVYLPTPSPSPSPSPSSPIPADCVLCEYILKHTAVMCMNRESVNQRTVYQVCMETTQTKQAFEHCQQFLRELVEIAGTEDPCDMLSCSEPRVTCQLDDKNYCHVAEFTGEGQSPLLGLDKNGNLLNPTSAYSTTSGLGPGDFKPGVKPYHSDNSKALHIPSRVRRAGHLLEPKKDALEEAELKDQEALKAQNDAAKLQPVPTPLPLSEVKMQL